MVVAMIGFTLNDAITKVSSETMNMAQVMLIRGAFSSLFVGLLAWQRGALGNLSSMLQPMVAMRVAGEAGATFHSSSRWPICRSPMSRPCCRHCRWL